MQHIERKVNEFLMQLGPQFPETRRKYDKAMKVKEEFKALRNFLKTAHETLYSLEQAVDCLQDKIEEEIWL